MIPFKIGNWLINEEGIEWAGEISNGYKISKQTISESGAGMRENVYDWLVHMPEKTWLTETDTYTLNTAVIYALECFKIGFNPKMSFVKTFIEQQQILEDKKTEDDEDI